MKGLIIVKKERATREYLKYLKLCKTRKDQQFEDLKKLYYQLSKGKKIIDIFEAFKFAGLNEKEEPRLAIARANLKEISFKKLGNGSGEFRESTWNYNKSDVHLPEGIFPNFKLKEGSTWDIKEPQTLKTKIPIICGKNIPSKEDLKNYFVLWEVEKWDIPPKDPFLLKRVTKNLFIIIDKWNLTKLEQALVSGR
jgi:hypothetical protein